MPVWVAISSWGLLLAGPHRRHACEPTPPLVASSAQATLSAAHFHHSPLTPTASEPYKGPGPFQRALAARQLAWASQQLAPPELDAALAAALLPTVLAASDDASAGVARLGAAALHHLSSSAPPAALGFQRELLLGRATKLVVGCEAGSWPTSMPAAVAVVLVGALSWPVCRHGHGPGLCRSQRDYGSQQGCRGRFALMERPMETTSNMPLHPGNSNPSPLPQTLLRRLSLQGTRVLTGTTG